MVGDALSGAGDRPAWVVAQQVCGFLGCAVFEQVDCLLEEGLMMGCEEGGVGYSGDDVRVQEVGEDVSAAAWFYVSFGYQAVVALLKLVGYRSFMVVEVVRSGYGSAVLAVCGEVDKVHGLVQLGEVGHGVVLLTEGQGDEGLFEEVWVEAEGRESGVVWGHEVFLGRVYQGVGSSWLASSLREMKELTVLMRSVPVRRAWARPAVA